MTDIKQEVSPVLHRAKTLVVKDEAGKQEAADTLSVIKVLRKKVKDTFGSNTKKAHAAWTAAKATEKEFDDPLKEAEQFVKNAVLDYDSELQREAQRKAAEEARQRFEEEEKKRKAEAEILRQDGLEKEAKQRLERKEEIVVAPVEVPKSEVKGITITEHWSAEVADLYLLCKAIVEKKVPIDMVMPNFSRLNQVARDCKGNLNYPGVTTICTKSVSNRTTANAAF